MKYSELMEIVKDLPFDKEKIILEDNGVILSVLRPSKLSKRFKNYDSKRNFQIWLEEKERNFKPNHLRVFIDLNLRVRSRPDLKKQLLVAMDRIFYGEDPNIAIKDLENENFDHYLNSIKIIANLSQLFLAEQEYGYTKESKYNPSTLFYQGWIRQSIAEGSEIDNNTMSVASFRPPMAKYTYLEDKKNKKYDENFKNLWYLEEN